MDAVGRGTLIGCIVGVALVPCFASTAAAEIAYQSAICDQGGAPASGPFGGCLSGIWRMHDDGSRQRRLTTGAPADPSSDFGGDGSPSWSPDGSRIVFTRRTGNVSSDLYMMSSNGSGEHRLNPGLSAAFVGFDELSWAPAGGHIAFVGNEDDVPGAGERGQPLFVMNDDGTGARQVSPDGWTVNTPDFTPDGKRIVFYGFPDRDVGYIRDVDGLYETDLQGSYHHQLTYGGDLLIAANGVALSPDGKYLAFTRSGGLYTLRLSDGDVVNRSPTDALTPTWSPVGPTIFFDGYPDRTAATEAFFSVDLSGARGERLVSPHERPVAAAEWGNPADVDDFDRVHDHSAPAVVTANELPHPAPTRAERRAAKLKGVKLSRIRFLAVDSSGIKRIDASVGKKGDNGCRFLRSGGELRPPSRCSKPRYFRVRHIERWREITEDLPKGTYHVRFRTTDVKGHRTKHPRRHVVRLH